jgi:hypothetical protein
MGRLKALFPNNYHSYIKPLHEDYTTQMVDKWNPYKTFYWDDAIKVANYLDYVTRKISKYGLHLSFIRPNKFENYKQAIQDEEDRLTEYFLYEMRKEPMERKSNPMNL